MTTSSVRTDLSRKAKAGQLSSIVWTSREKRTLSSANTESLCPPVLCYAAKAMVDGDKDRIHRWLF